MSKNVVKRVVEMAENGNKVVTLDFSDGTTKQNVKRVATKLNGVADNGLSIEGIRKAGYKVSVHHYRAFHEPCTDRVLFLPKHTKHIDPSLVLLTTGGYTHITILQEEWVDDGTQPIKTAERVIFSLYSVCSEYDLYSYKLGVKNALERITAEDAASLLDGTL